MNVVKELREMAGIQQKELAIVIGVTQPTVSDWENNKKDPKDERLERLASYFGVTKRVIKGLDPIPSSSSIESCPLTPSESELLAIFRDLNDNGQDALMRQARYLYSDPDMKRGSVSSTGTA